MNFIEIEFDNDLEIAEDVITGVSTHLIVQSHKTSAINSQKTVLHYTQTNSFQIQILLFSHRGFGGRAPINPCLYEECHADVEAKDDDGNTPIILASWDGHLEVVKYLHEECHANVEAKDNDGWTPIILASEKGHLEVVKYLII